jgi:hypothetical protein
MKLAKRRSIRHTEKSAAKLRPPKHRNKVELMRRALLITLVVSVAAVAVAAPQSKTPIQKDIEKLVALYSDGFATSYPKYWHIEFGKIFGGSREDAVAIFSIEGFDGGNDDHQYLAFFEAVDMEPAVNGKNRPFRLVAVTQIGGRGWREFDYQKVKQLGANFVTLNGQAYGPKDAMCCPSVPIQVTFHIKNCTISESK